jgi:hypothetical protein
MSEPNLPNRLPVDPHELAPADYCDPVIEFLKKNVDREQLRENLKLTVEERLLKAMRIHKELDEMRAAEERMRRESESSS